MKHIREPLTPSERVDIELRNRGNDDVTRLLQVIDRLQGNDKSESLDSNRRWANMDNGSVVHVPEKGLVHL